MCIALEQGFNAQHNSLAISNKANLHLKLEPPEVSRQAVEFFIFFFCISNQPSSVPVTLLCMLSGVMPLI